MSEARSFWMLTPFFLCCVLNKLLLLRGASESVKVEVFTVGTEFCSRFGIELACSSAVSMSCFSAPFRNASRSPLGGSYGV